MTPDLWLHTLETELRSMSPGDRKLILQDARDILREVAPHEIVQVLGTPADFARYTQQAFAHERNHQEPQAHIGPASVEFRGVTSAAVRARIWDPADPSLITSHLFGIGWGINLGAVAVKLGLIRPDDYDEETLRAIPNDVHQTSRSVPIVLTAIALGQAATHRNVSSLARIALAAIPMIWSRRATDRSEDALVRNAFASAAATLAVTPRRSPVIAGIVLFLQLIVPVRAGRAQLWRRKERHNV